MKCVSVGVFTNSSRETGVRLFPHGINLLWGSPLLVSLLLFFFLLASVQGISVAFVVKVCSLSFHSVCFSRKSFLKRVHFNVWTVMYLVYVF